MMRYLKFLWWSWRKRDVLSQREIVRSLIDHGKDAIGE